MLPSDELSTTAIILIYKVGWLMGPISIWHSWLSKGNRLISTEHRVENWPAIDQATWPSAKTRALVILGQSGLIQSPALKYRSIYSYHTWCFNEYVSPKLVYLNLDFFSHSNPVHMSSTLKRVWSDVIVFLLLYNTRSVMCRDTMLVTTI